MKAKTKKVKVVAGGEKHVVYKKTTKKGEGKVGNIMVNHPTKDKGQWDTIDLTAKGRAKTVKQGVAATKKWHKDNPDYEYSGNGMKKNTSKKTNTPKAQLGAIVKSAKKLFTGAKSASKTSKSIPKIVKRDLPVDRVSAVSKEGAKKGLAPVVREGKRIKNAKAIKNANSSANAELIAAGTMIATGAGAMIGLGRDANKNKQKKQKKSVKLSKTKYKF